MHRALQPSHDWAAHDPHATFGINANGTLKMAGGRRKICPEAPSQVTTDDKARLGPSFSLVVGEV